MRFPSKKSFVRASLLLIFAMPTLAHAETDKEKADREAAEAKAKVTAPAQYLDVKGAKEAFGSQFGVKAFDKEIDLFGGTSKVCRELYDITASGEDGTFQIKFKGGDQNCLHYSDATKDVADAELVSLASSDDGKMTPTGTFASVNLVAPKGFSSAGSSEEMKGEDGASISHESAAKIAERQKQEKEDELNSRKEKDLKFITKCVHGLDELNVRGNAIDDLQKTVALIADKDSDYDDAFFKSARANTRKRIFAGCSLQYMHGSVEAAKSKKDDDGDDFDRKLTRKEKKAKKFSRDDCDSQFESLAKEDDKYVQKIADLYTDYINKQMKDQPLGLETAYTEAKDMLEKLRTFAEANDAKLDDGYDAKIDKLERKMHLKFLALAAKGEDPEFFNSMKSDMVDYMATDVEHAACFEKDGKISDKEIRYPTAFCKDSRELSVAIIDQTGVAIKTQGDLLVKKQQADLIQDCSTVRTNEAVCKSMEATMAKQASTLANGSLNTAADGHSQIVNSDGTIGTTGGAPLGGIDYSTSGLMKSDPSLVNKATTTTTPTVTAPTTINPNASQNVTLNTAAPGLRKIGH